MPELSDCQRQWSVVCQEVRQMLVWCCGVDLLDKRKRSLGCRVHIRIEGWHGLQVISRLYDARKAAVLVTGRLLHEPVAVSAFNEQEFRLRVPPGVTVNVAKVKMEWLIVWYF